MSKRPPTQAMFGFNEDPDVEETVSINVIGGAENANAELLSKLEGEFGKPEPVKRSKPAQKDELGPPMMEFDLPSGGQFGYPKQLSYRDVLVKDEETLASATQQSYVRVLNSVIKSVLNSPDFYEDMTVPDRDYAMIWVWANNYEPVKKLEMECQSCGKKDVVSIDLTKLEVTKPKKTLKGETFDGSFELLLRSKQPVTVSLATVKNELAAERLHKDDKSYSYEFIMLALSITPINPLLSEKQHLKWVKENITGREMAIIRQFHEKYNYGTVTKLTHSCSACKEVAPFDLPFSIKDILHPTVQYDFEE